MAPDGSGCIKNSSKSKHGLKKGPWTAAEDMLLVEYVKKHGEGNWNAVQTNSGLMRCGKSCRLRWANHLRPNLKKGAFSSDEEKLIVELHAKLGNKWARMAAQLPGRTDNEIKNYWNTRLKRHQRAGLPIYPQELHQNQDENQQLYSSSKSPLSSLLLATPHHPNPNPLHFFNSFNRPPIQIIPSYNSQELKLFHDNNNNNLTLSLAASNPSTFLNQGLTDSLLMPSILQYNSLDFGSGSGVSGLPSIQSAVTPAASSSEFVIETSSDDVEDYEMDGFSRRKNSGLLEDLLGESQALTEKTENSCIAAAGNEHEKEFFSFDYCDENNIEGKKQMGHRDGTNFMEDDILNLLDNFPLAVPIPDWNEGHTCDESPQGTNGTIESQPEDTQYNPVTISSGAKNQEWGLESCLWNDMPGIY